MKNTRIELVEKILYIIASVVLVGGIVFYAIKDTMLCKKYGKPKYEFVVTDMYEDLGAVGTWLAGGRPSRNTTSYTTIVSQTDQTSRTIWYGSAARRP